MTQLCIVIIQTIRIVLILLVGTVSSLLYILHDAIDHSCIMLAEEHLFGKELVLSVAVVVVAVAQVVQVVVAGLVEAIVDDGDAVAAAEQLLGGTQQQ